MKGRPSSFVFEIVLLFTFLLLPFYFLPFPLRYFTSPSHLQFGCHSELHFMSADRAGRNSVESFPWFLHVISFVVLVHAGRRYSCPIDLCLTILSFVVTFFHGGDPHSHRISHAEPSVPAGAVGKSWVDSVVSVCDFVRCFDPCLTFLSFLLFTWLCPESHPHLNSSPCLLLLSHPILPPSSDACGILFRFSAPTDASSRSWGRHAYNCFVHTWRRLMLCLYNLPRIVSLCHIFSLSVSLSRPVHSSQLQEFEAQRRSVGVWQSFGFALFCPKLLFTSIVHHCFRYRVSSDRGLYFSLGE